MSLPIVPPLVLALVLPYLKPLLAWLSTHLYAQLVARAPRHLLVQLRALLDVTALVQACAPYHHAPGTRGAPPTYPVPCLVAALLLGVLYHLSLRALEERLRWDLLARWFCGLSLWADTPDHTTLERFEVWVLQHHPRLYFDEVLAQLDAAGDGEREQIQVADTFALRANAALETRRELLQHLTRRLLETLRAWDPPAEEQLQARLDAGALWGTPNEPWDNRLTAEARRARLLATARAAYDGSAQVREYLQRPSAADLPPAARTALQTWLALLDKVFQDEFLITVGPHAGGAVDAPAARCPVPPDTQPALPPEPTVQGACSQPQTPQTPQTSEVSERPAAAPSAAGPSPTQADYQVQERPPGQRGTYRMVTATDPEATVRAHGDSRVVGCNVQVTATRHVVRAIEARRGAEPDHVGIPGLLTDQATHQHGLPPVLVYDKAGGNAKTHAQVAAVSQQQTRLVAKPPLSELPLAGGNGTVPLPRLAVGAQGYPAHVFQLSAEGGTLSCPRGEQTTHVSPRPASYEARRFYFAREQCHLCPLACACFGAKSKALRATPPDAPVPVTPSRGRVVDISDYHEALQVGLAYLRSPAGQAALKLRPEIERHIAVLVRYEGARRARRVGLAAADFQVKMSAVAFNLKGWVRRRLARRAQTEREHADEPAARLAEAATA